MEDCDQTTPVIVLGEDKQLKLVFKDECGERFSLSGLTGCSVNFKRSNGTTLSKNLGVGSAEVIAPSVNGELLVYLSDSETGLLLTGERMSLTAVLDFGTVRRIVNFSKAISIKAPAVT